ncbi:acyl-CoA dehydrogenase family protein [Nocardia sp. SC052]|uniref:acyl-CoA dehydrogenase family protein n=1 Tax=Nocardia sichangensis TaxID=3385975 RepID=UPI0039A0EC30
MTISSLEEQQDLRRTVRAFLETKSPETEVRRLMETREGYDPDVWQQLGTQLGLLGLTIPEELGGSGTSFVELCIAMEEMGAALLCAPYFSTVVLASTTLLQAADAAMQKEYLPLIAAGELIATIALTEESGRWDESGVAMRASKSGVEWKLDGTKMFVLDGCTADLVITCARTDAGISLFAVDASAPGLTRTSMNTMDRTRKQARLEFRGAPGRLIGAEGTGWKVLGQVLDLAAIALAAEQVGGTQRCLDMALTHARNRIQFGRPIGSFQAIKHKCSNILIGLESAKSAVYHAASCAAESSSEVPVMASLAKAHCSDTFFHAAAENIQIHGGIGFTWEHSAHLYFKRAKASEVLFGDGIYHREQLAQRIGI